MADDDHAVKGVVLINREPGIKARGVTSVETIRRVHWDRWMRALHLYTHILLIALISGASDASAAEVLVEAEGFSDCGGWLQDPQFMDVMGSPYLLAHGLGKPVADAATEVAFPQAGSYRLWVRTKDWVPAHHPGVFRVVVDGTELAVTFGNRGQGWIWQDGGKVEVKKGRLRIELRDWTGFDGRCDALFFTTEMDFTPPDRPDEKMAAWRRLLLGLAEIPPPAAGRNGGVGDGSPTAAASQFDVVVVGGGLAGCSAALAAARRGLEVALIQNRPVLGGNGSPEIGITPRGENRSLVQELAGPDREQVLRAQSNIHLFLGWHAFRVQRHENRIVERGCQAHHNQSGTPVCSALFIDCTGNGSIGAWAGAEYRLGGRPAAEFHESLAPPIADKMHHGNTVVFRTRTAAQPTTSPMFRGRSRSPRITPTWAGRSSTVMITSAVSRTSGSMANGWTRFRTPSRFGTICCRRFTGRSPMRNTANRSRTRTWNWPRWVTCRPPASPGDSWVITCSRRTISAPSGHSRTPWRSCQGHFCLHYPGDKYDFRLGDWKWISCATPIRFRCGACTRETSTIC